MGDLISFESRRVGKIEVTEAEVVTFEPLPGFPGLSRFVIMEHAEGGEMAWLVSIEDPDLAFVVATPWSFFPNYDPPVQREHVAALGIEKSEEVEILSIVTLSGKSIFLNLAAPLVINVTTRRGIQVVGEDPRYSTRMAIPPLEPAATARSAATAATATPAP
ncbi:MAG: flagellar assembly protein FliW [Deltaproteobacteria bacterium]|nr:flagellar assembly protein FliW [Deltaproteobacteria bacterium]